MADKFLVIVESPAKARTIERFLGTKAKVLASYGHVRDLPKSTMGIDVEHDFEPKYIIPKKATKVINDLKAAAKTAKSVYLATDPDREGEAIAWHVAEALGLLGKKDKSIQRIEFHEITATAINKALEKPTDLNYDLINAQQARRVVDRLVGYSISPLLWKVLYRGLSAGRVQSVALRLIVDREAERDGFKPTEYWSLEAIFTTDKKETFSAKLTEFEAKPLGKYPVQKLIEQALEKVKETKAWKVKDVKSDRQQRHPSAPFTTSTLQQEASRKLHFSAKQTMGIAQKLYEGVTIDGETTGLITYMRTDSLNMAEEALKDARETASKLFGEKNIPAEPQRYKTKSKGAQEAHEAVRPTLFGRTPEVVAKYLDTREAKLYELIWKRAIASQMVSADVERTQVAIGGSTQPEILTFTAYGTVVVNPGFLKVYEEGKDANDEDLGNDAKSDDQSLPKMATGESVTLKERESKQHFTEPAPRFTEASLVKELEKRGIGRPSTYAPTMSTIIDRGYVVKDGSAFVPQEVGKTAVKWLKEHFADIVDYDFTARMEEDLDSVADGEKDWHKVVGEFYKPFSKQVEAVKKDKVGEKLMDSETDEKCQKCGKPLAIKMGRFGKFYACTGFPDCRYTRPYGETAEAQAKQAEIVEGRKCPTCGSELVVKAGRFGTFIGCSKYPDCKFIEAIDKNIGIKCPKDGGEIVEKRTRKGKMFWGCGNYPKCDFASWNKPTDQKCKVCQAMMVEVKDGLVCSVDKTHENS